MSNLGDPTLRSLIKNANWDELTPRWLAYTQFRLSSREVREGRHHKTPQDFVHQAIAEVLGGKHEYHGGSLFQFVAAVIDALIRRNLGR
jgi:hypothetical protein